MDFDLDDLDATDTAEMTVISNGKLTEWAWTFAGPGHENTLAQDKRLMRERLHDQHTKEQSAANRKKWKGTEQTPDEALKERVSIVIDRLLGWSDVKMSGKLFPFSEMNARKILSDPRKGALLVQALEFLSEETSFMTISDEKSGTMQKETLPSDNVTKA